MTFIQELTSWLFAPKAPRTSTIPQPGQPAPDTPKIPLEPHKRTIIAFLRHCGCPFAEKTFLHMREAAQRHPDVDFIAVSHSDQRATDNWLQSLPDAGSKSGNVRVVVDDKLEGYAAWGLGPSGLLHVLNPTSLGAVSTLGKEGIRVRSTESGSRWQTSGTYAVGGDGRVKFGGPARRADDMPDFEQFVREAGP